MTTFDENTINRLSSVPPEVMEFIQECEGIDFDFDNCNIDIEGYTRYLHYQIEEKRVNIIMDERNPFNDKSIQVSFRNSIDYSAFLEEFYQLKRNAPTDREQYIEDFVNFITNCHINGDDDYYDEIVSSYVFKNKCENTQENVLKALREEAEIEYHSATREIQEMNAFYNETQVGENKLNIEAFLHTSNIDIAYFENVIKGGLYTPTGGIILFEAELDENRMARTINENLYDSVSDVAFTSYDFEIDYRELSVDSLSDNGVNPVKSELLDFSSLLKEHNLEHLQQKPMVAIYNLRDVLLSKTFTSSSTNAI